MHLLKRSGTILLMLGISTAGQAQDVRPTAATSLDYSAKYICGLRAPGTQADWDAVSPGEYRSAVNIRNPNADTVRFAYQIATTAAEPVGGQIFPGGMLFLTSGQALEIDCAEILRLTRLRFSKGFVVLSANWELDVIVVYTAGQRGAVQSIDVERITPRRGSSCPDLVINIARRPGLTSDRQRTQITLRVGNIGNEAANNIQVQAEDPNRTSLPNPALGIQTTTIPQLDPGASTTVTLEFPYAITTNSGLAAITYVVDPKNIISECREDNNSGRVGS